jgi:hypothetical protein
MFWKDCLVESSSNDVGTISLYHALLHIVLSVICADWLILICVAPSSHLTGAKATVQQFVFPIHRPQKEAAGFGRMSNWLPKYLIFSGQASLTLILSGFFCWGGR